MTLIHPIVPVAARPPAVDPVRRVKRTGDDAEPEERREPRRETPPRNAPATPAVTADGHLDTRA